MELYFSELATAFVRGRLGDPTASIDDGLAAGLRLHKFKQNQDLVRVRRVLSLLRGLAPAALLGSGRETFLWLASGTRCSDSIIAEDTKPARCDGPTNPPRRDLLLLRLPTIFEVESDIGIGIHVAGRQLRKERAPLKPPVSGPDVEVPVQFVPRVEVELLAEEAPGT